MKIVIACCDAYHDIARTWEWLWFHHWPDCPYDIYYVSNSKPLRTNNGTEVLIPGADLHFGRRMRTFISTHLKPDDDTYILFGMADYLVQSMNVPLIEKARAQCEVINFAHVRLLPYPHPQHAFDDTFGEIDKRKPYSLSLQYGIWHAKSFHKLLRDEENPWHTETHGSSRTRKINGKFLCCHDRAIVNLNYYAKGKPFGMNWVRDNVPETHWPSAVRKEYS
jgi:hypothetical protein